MKDQSLLGEIQDAAETIQAHAEYLEELNGDGDSDVFQGDGEGRYEMRVTLSVTSDEMDREQAEQHCRKLAGSLRNDSAVGRFDIANTEVRKLDEDTEE